MCLPLIVSSRDVSVPTCYDLWAKYTTIVKATPWAPLPKSWIWVTNTIVSVTTERMRHQTLRLEIEDKRRGWRHRLARIKSSSF